MKVEPALSSYEKERLERIAKNKRLLATLQINEAVNALEEHCTKVVEARRPPKKHPPKAATKPRRVEKRVRRSSRLIGKAPNYNEKTLVHETPRYKTHLTKEEVYAERHVELLGCCTKEWYPVDKDSQCVYCDGVRKLFVDGYDENGVRIHDPVNGKTCHQCRQKTRGKRTACSKCSTLKGSFCGDCLFMRYGENIDEVKDSEEWICPCCRDICNCSFCRIAKGWPPTGPMYRKAIAEGYKSVAHYLVLRSQSDKENLSPQSEKKEKAEPERVMTRSMGAARNVN